MFQRRNFLALEWSMFMLILHVISSAPNYDLLLNPLTTSVSHHIQNSQLICITNQLTGFYMMENIGR